jgi:hypothetical protein
MVWSAEPTIHGSSDQTWFGRRRRPSRLLPIKHGLVGPADHPGWVSFSRKNKAGTWQAAGLEEHCPDSRLGNHQTKLLPGRYRRVAH